MCNVSVINDTGTLLFAYSNLTQKATKTRRKYEEDESDIISRLLFIGNVSVIFISEILQIPILNQAFNWNNFGDKGTDVLS